MKRPPRLVTPSIRLDRCAPAPLYAQIVEALKQSIVEKGPGSRLPSSRVLAQELQISRNTVLTAYAELTAEGLLTGQVGSGTRVAGGKIGPPRPQELIARSGYPTRIVTFEDSDGTALYIRR